MQHVLLEAGVETHSKNLCSCTVILIATEVDSECDRYNCEGTFSKINDSISRTVLVLCVSSGSQYN